MVLACLSCVLNCGGVFGAEMVVSFRSSGVGPNAEFLGSFGQPTYYLGTINIV